VNPRPARRPRPALAVLAPLVLAALPARAGAGDVAWIWPGAVEPSPAPDELAVLTVSVHLGREGILLRPRRTPLVPPPGVRVTPVVHVQPERGAPPLAPPDARRIAAALLRAAPSSTSGLVQLDFEAPPSMRDAWRALVADVRRALPPEVRLSVTALGSWCAGGAWLDGLAADEVVPMFFAPGPGTAPWRLATLERAAALHPRCRAGAAGFSVQDAPPAEVRRRYARRYWFHERPHHPYAVPPPEPSR
jgi:hypothetical protein